MISIVGNRFQCAWMMGVITSSIIYPSNATAQEKADTATRPASALEAVVVSATRSEQALGTLPYPVHVIGAPAIAATPSGTVPDMLRSIPGFTTRDYQSSYVTSPSQSIATFRGLGGSSAGRVLVLLDGIPIGDPFSGWLDWGRIPLPMLASAEAIRGGGSIVWGSRALGGVINLRTITPRRDQVTMLVEGGTFDTRHGTAVATVKREKFSAVVGADYVDTDGFILIPPHQAGPVDEPKAMRSRVVSGKASYDVTQSVQAWLGASSFVGGERPWGIRDKQTFDEGRAGVRWLSSSNGVATFGVFSNRRSAISKSYTINSDRTTKTPQRYGDSPARSSGLNLQWTQVLRQRHEVSTGVDFSAASGSVTEEYAFAGDAATQEREAGASQRLAGIFIQDAADLGHSIRMVASLRLDRVHSINGSRTVRSLPARNVLSDSSVNDHTDARFTYSLGFRKQQATWLGLRANVYEAFRAPSMYEMYHPRFSSRGTVTEANSQLDAERLKGAEAGLDVTVGRTTLARVTAFTNNVVSPIMDVTIATAGNQAEVISPCGMMPAGQTCSQRQNVPRLRSDGFEAELSWQPSAIWSYAIGYSYSWTKVRASGQPVDGKQALRSSPHSIVSSIEFTQPRWFSAAVEGRYVGSRFEDDLNTIELDEFYLFGVRVNKELGSRMTAHLKVDNLLDEDFEISRARSGLAERGAKRWLTLGLRTTW